MIAAAVIAVVGFIAWALKQFRDIQIAKQEIAVKGATDEAKKIVEAKSDDQLVDDFNKRFSDDGS